MELRIITLVNLLFNYNKDVEIDETHINDDYICALFNVIIKNEYYNPIVIKDNKVIENKELMYICKNFNVDNSIFENVFYNIADNNFSTIKNEYSIHFKDIYNTFRILDIKDKLGEDVYDKYNTGRNLQNIYDYQIVIYKK